MKIWDQFQYQNLSTCIRDIEITGESRIITDRGKPTLEIRKLRTSQRNSLDILKGTVLIYDRPTDPVGGDEWENA